MNRVSSFSLLFVSRHLLNPYFPIRTKMLKAWVLAILFVTVLVSLCNPRGLTEIGTTALSSSKASHFSSAFGFLGIHQRQELQSLSPGLEYDYYRQTCPDAENIVRSAMALLYSQHKDVSASLLRLFFHDCFIRGCDASVLLDDSNANISYSSERQAIPNLTLKGFDKIDIIKEEIERVCPRVVSCADIISLATRDGIVLAGGPFYPIFTGRRDSNRSYFVEAMADMPRPNDNINRTLDLFAVRGFNERDTVSLLGGHNIGKIGCQFIMKRLYNFSGTGKPDPSIDPVFLNLMRVKCQENQSSSSISQDGESAAPTPLLEASTGKLRRSVLGMSYNQELSSSLSSRGSFDNHYYKSLLMGRGLLFADQQLMAHDITAKLVEGYASDDSSTFRMDFARAMVKLSVLNVLTGSQGQVRERCNIN